MTDLIRRADAIRELSGVCSTWEDDAKVQEIVMAIPSTKPTGELISKTDAVELLTEIVFDEPPYLDSETLCRLYAEEQINTLASAEIAETEPIVIRSKTLMPTKDFKEWAKRIREVNPNTVVIPCDAEVVSDEAVRGEWILECDSEGEGDNLYRCSECGSKYGCQEYDKPNFCPNCGTRMKPYKGGEDE